MDDAVPIGSVARALGVSIDTLRRWEANGELKFRRRGNQRVLPASELVKLVRRHNQPPPQTSARNHFDGVVVEVKREGLVATVELACGAYRVLSLITSEALDELKLKPGDDATAVVKASHVIIDRPDRRTAR
jgi:molybdopterin-binding protein